MRWIVADDDESDGDGDSDSDNDMWWFKQSKCEIDVKALNIDHNLSDIFQSFQAYPFILLLLLSFNGMLSSSTVSSVQQFNEK